MAYNSPQELALIQTLSASNSATISFTSGISSNFPSFVVKIRNYVPASNGSNLQMLWSTNGGSSYLGGTSYLYASLLTATSTNTHPASTGTAFFQLAPSVSSTAAQALNGELILHNMSDANLKNFMGTFEYESSGSAISYISVVGSNGTTAINAIQFLSSTGNITSGTFDLYGVNE